MSLERKVSLVVCGKFHYFNYVKHLDNARILKQFVFSHRWDSNGKLGLNCKLNNLWPLLHLLLGHLRIVGTRGVYFMWPYYHAIWQWQLEHCLQPACLLHFLLHGNSFRALSRAKENGTFLVAEAVNSHPTDYFGLIEEESENLGLSIPKKYHASSIVKFNIEIGLANQLLVPSQFVKNSFVRRGFPAERIRCIPYGVDITDFRPKDTLPARSGLQPFRVICAAQIDPRKGHQYLLRAWKKLSLTNAELHFYGLINDKLLGALLKIKAPNVHFHGPVDKQTLIDALQQSHLFVLPTVEDGFAIAVTEAMACGLPVITTNNAGASERIIEGQEGFVVPIRSVEQLSEKIEWMYRHRAAAREMGLAGRRLAETSLNWKGYADQLIAYYSQCMSDAHIAI